MAKKKKYIIAQTPNLPIIVWFITFLLQLISILAPIHPLLSLISFGAIFTWAWLEIFEGANNFRRGLGIAVMTFILVIRVI